MHVTFLGKLEWGIAQIVTKAMVGSECESVGGGIVCIRLMRALLPGGVTCHLLDTNNDSPLPRDAGRGHAWNVAAVCGVCIIVHCPENPGAGRAGQVVLYVARKLGWFIVSALECAGWCHLPGGGGVIIRASIYTDNPVTRSHPRMD